MCTALTQSDKQEIERVAHGFACEHENGDEIPDDSEGRQNRLEDAFHPEREVDEQDHVLLLEAGTVQGL